MAKGKKTGGRVKGTLNRDTLTVREKAETLGIDPYEILLLFAKGDWKALGYTEEFIEVQSKDCTNYQYVIDPAVRARCAAEAVQYIEPKRKAIEHSGLNGGPIEVRDVTTRSDAQLAQDLVDDIAKAPEILQLLKQKGIT